METLTNTFSSSDIGKIEAKKFFESIRDELNLQEFMISEGSPSVEFSRLVKAASAPDPFEMIKFTKGWLTYELAKKVSITFLENLKGQFPKKLAIACTNNEFLVWAEITEYDEPIHDNLILAASRTNVALHDIDFYVKLSVVESSDNFPVPPHYTVLN